MSIGYVTLGTDDLNAALPFYDAVLMAASCAPAETTRRREQNKNSFAGAARVITSHGWAAAGAYPAAAFAPMWIGWI